MMKVELLEGGLNPIRATDGSAGFDLFSPTDLKLDVGLHKIPLKFKMELPRYTFGNIRCRSSLAKRGMSVEAGVIDEDYRGEVQVMLRVREPFECKRGHAIAQLIVQRYCVPRIFKGIVNPTRRGDGGFGSTDNKN
tara:strand:- start:11173 stop:11580 length:408 start_codon:yes stop_codon:yes gene_type:complete